MRGRCFTGMFVELYAMCPYVRPVFASDPTVFHSYCCCIATNNFANLISQFRLTMAAWFALLLRDPNDVVCMLDVLY